MSETEIGRDVRYVQFLPKVGFCIVVMETTAGYYSTRPTPWRPGFLAKAWIERKSRTFRSPGSIFSPTSFMTGGSISQLLKVGFCLKVEAGRRILGRDSEQAAFECRFPLQGFLELWFDFQSLHLIFDHWSIFLKITRKCLFRLLSSWETRTTLWKTDSSTIWISQKIIGNFQGGHWVDIIDQVSTTFKFSNFCTGLILST